jgi:hypothetical protein
LFLFSGIGLDPKLLADNVFAAHVSHDIGTRPHRQSAPSVAWTPAHVGAREVHDGQTQTERSCEVKPFDGQGLGLR